MLDRVYGHLAEGSEQAMRDKLDAFGTVSAGKWALDGRGQADHPSGNAKPRQERGFQKSG
jgi:hypothetical protein